MLGWLATSSARNAGRGRNDARAAPEIKGLHGGLYHEGNEPMGRTMVVQPADRSETAALRERVKRL